MEEYYTIKQVSELTGCPETTLRYYEKEGLLPPIRRNEMGVRVFTEYDVERIRSVQCLKATGMPVYEIKKFEELFKQGETTYMAQRKMILIQKHAVEAKLEELNRYLDHIKWKMSIYNNYFGFPEDCEEMFDE